MPSVETLLEAIKKQTEWRAAAGPGDFRPEWKHPATWLNQKCWEDETETVIEIVAEKDPRFINNIAACQEFINEIRR
jgi:hypothetical protein